MAQGASVEHARLRDQDQDRDFVAQDQDSKNESRDQDLSLENYITALYQSAPGPAGGSARSPGLPTFAFLPPPMVETESIRKDSDVGV